MDQLLVFTLNWWLKEYVYDELDEWTREDSPFAYCNSVLKVESEEEHNQGSGYATSAHTRRNWEEVYNKQACKSYLLDK